MKFLKSNKKINKKMFSRSYWVFEGIIELGAEKGRELIGQEPVDDDVFTNLIR